MGGLLLAAIDVPDELVEDFHRWYDTEHVPERLAVPGIGPVTRWQREVGVLPRFLALFELESPEVIESGAYAALKGRGDTPWTARLRPRFTDFERLTVGLAADYGGRPGTATACAVALTDVAPGDEDAYRRWYDEDHGPAVAAVDGVVRVRRFERAGDGPRHLTVLELTGSDVLAGPAYAAAKAATPDGGLRERWARRQATYTVRDDYRQATVSRSGDRP